MAALEGRTALVTGASGNLGTAVCRRLLAGGAKVAGLVRSEAAGEELRAALGAAERFAPIVGELTDEASAESAVAAVEARLGPLWAAVHTVGGWAGGKPVAQSGLRDLDAMLSVNLKTAFVLARAALRSFELRREGRLVNVAAYTAAVGVKLAGSAAYAASKAGLIGLTRALAEEGAAIGVRANCVAPGTMRTPQNSAGMPAADASRWVALEEVAEAIAFLCDPAASGVNGNVVLLPER